MQNRGCVIWIIQLLWAVAHSRAWWIFPSAWDPALCLFCHCCFAPDLVLYGAHLAQLPTGQPRDTGRGIACCTGINEVWANDVVWGLKFVLVKIYKMINLFFLTVLSISRQTELKAPVSNLCVKIYLGVLVLILGTAIDSPKEFRVEGFHEKRTFH